MNRSSFRLSIVLPALAAAAFLVGSTSPATAASNTLENLTGAFKSVNTGHDPKHTPKITAPKKVKAGEWFDVTIEIGAEMRHPSLSNHAVRYIALYRDEVEISRTYLHPVYSSPKVTYTIALEESVTLKAMEEPNHTGPWVTEFEIEVEPAPEAEKDSE